MRKLLSAVLLLCASVCFGQGATIPFQPAVTQQGNFLSFATITFCSIPTTINTLGVCQTPVTVFKDQAMALPYSSAIQTDGIGYFPPNAVTATSIWFAPGTYCYTLTVSSMTSPATNPCTPFTISFTASGGSLNVPGNITQTQPTAATNVANQSSFLDCMNASYWTGSISATDQWCFQDVLGTGSNPTSTFTLTHGGSPGSSGIPLFSVPSNVSVGALNVSKVIRDCRTDNLKCDGTTDDSAAINACLSNAYSAGYGGVQLPSGQCKVNTTINDTNKPNLDFFGSNSNEDWSTTTTNQNFGTTLTQLLCNTGATPCFDVTGTGRARLMNFGLRAASGYTSPSQIAFMFGRDNAVSGPAWTTGTGTFCFAQENKLENVWVYFDTRPAATAVGTVAIYNVGAEQFQILGGGYIADNPVFITATNDLSLASPYQTLATGCPASMTEVKVGHGASFQAWTRSAFDLRGVIDFESEKDTEILNGVIGTNHSSAVTINSGSNVPTNITLQGQDEGFDFPLTLNTSVEGLDARLTAVAPTAAGLVTIGNGITVSDCYINMPQINGTIQPLVNILSGTATMRGCIIFEGKNLGTGAGAANVTLTNSTIYAPGLTDTQVNTFKSGSSYNVQDSTGNSTVGNYSVGGNLGVGAASSAGVGVLENNSALTGTSQFGIQAAPSTSSAATAEGAGLVGRADTAAAAFVQALNVGVHVTTPTVGAGSSITEWDGVRIEKAPTAGTKCSLFVAGSTSGSACVNAPATAGVSSTLPSTAGTLTVTIGSGTVTTAGTAVTNGTCQAQTGITVTGAATTDVAACSLNAAAPATWQTGIFLAVPEVTANTVTVRLCNGTAASITPAAATVRCSVTR